MSYGGNYRSLEPCYSATLVDSFGEISGFPMSKLKLFEGEHVHRRIPNIQDQGLMDSRTTVEFLPEPAYASPMLSLRGNLACDEQVGLEWGG